MSGFYPPEENDSDKKFQSQNPKGMLDNKQKINIKIAHFRPNHIRKNGQCRCTINCWDRRFDYGKNKKDFHKKLDEIEKKINDDTTQEKNRFFKSLKREMQKGATEAEAINQVVDEMGFKSGQVGIMEKEKQIQ